MSTLAFALREAGIETSADIKRRWCLEAWAKYPGNQGDERRQYVLLQFNPAQTLFYEQAHTLMMIGKALNEVRHEIRDAAEAAGGGQTATGIHVSAAPSNSSGRKPDDAGQKDIDTQRVDASVEPSRDAAEAAGGGQNVSGIHAYSAPSNPSGRKPDDAGHEDDDTQLVNASVEPSRDAASQPPQESAILGTTPKLTAPAPASNERERASGAASPRSVSHFSLSPRTEAIASAARRLSTLDRGPEGIPVRRMVVNDFRRWARNSRVWLRWGNSTLSNMPGNWVIGDHVTDDDADRAFGAAEEAERAL